MPPDMHFLDPIRLTGSDMSLINSNTTATVRNLSFARMGKF